MKELLLIRKVMCIPLMVFCVLTTWHYLIQKCSAKETLLLIEHV